MPSPRALLRLGVLAAGSSLIHPAYSAPTKQQKADCAEAFNQGQKQLKGGQLKAAQKRFVACSQPACPAVLVTDCLAAVGELDRRLPSVIFDAKDSRGVDVVEVKISEKDGPVTEALDGQAILLDPGIHDFHFAYKTQEIDQRVVLRDGDKLRHVSVVFDQVPPPAASASEAPAGSATGGPPEAAGHSFSAGVVTLGALGLVGLGLAAYFDVKGRSDLSALKSDCAPRCAPSQVDSARTKLRVGDLSLALGVVALGGATLLYFSSSGVSTSPPPAETASFRLSPTMGGAFGSFQLSLP